ncbi:protein OS-9-like isoform X1 [Branchiostoma lanceolatum]|uniref:protein OS-9-like isoform X1 n=2 Tax=Branchiostoma lanceolatum TaxID=7740 RepID=UPI0034540FDC
MEEGGRKIVFLCSLLLFFHQMNCLLHIEELNEMKYGIEIQNTPVERTEALLPDVLYVASKYGQEYQCVLPKVSGQGEGEEEEEEENQQNLNISYLLAPMGKAPCLTKEKDWWTYEFCYGKNIRQYHMEEGEIKGDIYYIGFYESDKNWTNTSNEAAGSHRLQRYHSQKYVNGTTCDLTGHYRQAEVRFLCEEGMGDYINRVDEPSSCNYIITIHTTKICHHPYLRPLQSHKPQPIMCNPVLPHEQFVEYLRIQEESELRQKAKIAELKRKLQEKKATLEKEKEREEQKLKENLAKIGIDRRKEMEMENTDDSAMNNLDAELEISRTPGTGTNEISDSMVSIETDETEDAVVMETRSMDDVQKGEGLGRGSVKVAMPTREDLDEDDDDDDEDDDMEVEVEKEDEEEEDEKEDNDMVETMELRELNKALRKLQKTLLEAMEKGVKEAEDDGAEIDIEDVDQKIESLNFDNSVDTGDLRKVVRQAVQERLQKQTGEQEASQDAMGQETEDDDSLRYTSQQEEMTGSTEDDDEDEEEEEEEEEEDAEFVKEFEEELGGLKHKSRLSKMTNKVREEMTKQFDDIIDEAEEELHAEEGTDPGVDRSDAARKLANTLNKLLEKMEKKSATETKGEGGKVDTLEEEEEEEEEPPFTTPPSKQDLRSKDQVKVRVTKIQLGDKDRAQENKGHDGISAQDRRKMEETVKEELEKAGMKTQGNIEVKIITTGYYGDDDDVHLLGDEETSYFREMIVTMLMGGEEALAEQRRQQQLEENYRFKFTPAPKEVLSEAEHSRTETEDTDK